MIRHRPLLEHAATDLNGIISHWKAIVSDLKKFEWWHKPQQIKEACVPDPAMASAGEQKLNSIVC